MAGNMLSNTEVMERNLQCYKMRYEQEGHFKQKDWIKYCHETYGDKTEQQYCKYWSNAKKIYDEGWKERLSKLLGPAVDELTRALASEDEKIRTRAVDQIMKYTGNDIQKIQADVRGDININFGNDE